MKKRFYIIPVLLMLVGLVQANDTEKAYWAVDALITSHRLPLPPAGTKIIYEDLDHDGDPDLLKSVTSGQIPILWIDDDDDMRVGDLEGDIDSDCLMIDRNRDGQYGAGLDLIIDWNDEDGDNQADMQVIVDNPRTTLVKGEGWGEGFWGKGHYMWVIDTDGDQIFNYIDWKTFKLECWEHSGQARFFEDYHGQSLFIKNHTPTFAMDDVRYNWENPFLFYDEDSDGQSEIAIRIVDTQIVNGQIEKLPEDGNIPDAMRSVNPSKKVDWISIGIDLDNDNGPANEFDFDISFRLTGPGVPYHDEVHVFQSMRGLPESDSLFYDPRWRQATELIYPDHDAAWNYAYHKGQWDQVWLVFDEDDDCHRWERVEFYEPRSVFKIGAQKGGLDHNPQADCSGDRGEWDTDYSGKGQVYLGFDGRIHLLGAEWGAWRIDQDASWYQGWQGWRNGSETEPEAFASIRYDDKDSNGYFDFVSYDLNGDHAYELEIDFKALGIDDHHYCADPKTMTYSDWQGLYQTSAETIWKGAQQAAAIAQSMDISTNWYAQQKQALSLREKYHLGFWLTFYLYMDMRDLALRQQNSVLLAKIDAAYHSGRWEMLAASVQQ